MTKIARNYGKYKTILPIDKLIKTENLGLMAYAMGVIGKEEAFKGYHDDIIGKLRNRISTEVDREYICVTELGGAPSDELETRDAVYKLIRAKPDIAKFENDVKGEITLFEMVKLLALQENPLAECLIHFPMYQQGVEYAAATKIQAGIRRMWRVMNKKLAAR